MRGGVERAGSAAITAPQRLVDPGHGIELLLLLAEQGKLGLPQAVLLIQPGLYPGGTGLEASPGKPFRLFGKRQLLGQIVQALLAVMAGGQAVFHLDQGGIKLLAKFGFGNLVIKL